MNLDNSVDGHESRSSLDEGVREPADINIDEESHADWHRRSGLRALPELGQYFLRSETIAKQLAASVAAERPTLVVEVGAGLGTLSSAICRAGIPLVAIEIDVRIREALTLRLADYGERARVVIADFLELAPFDIPDGTLLVSILPFDARLGRSLLNHAFREYSSVVRSVVVAPDQLAAALAQDFYHISRVGDIPADAFWPHFDGVLGIYRISGLKEVLH